ncbi:type II toxin-antitoxin system HicA family toxin [Hyphomicrobium sp.]|uniref:type II toxin-antitoxin system HicA family toxin n=1 Tax=Hyphomicrobium sp. TaxID=82 RepID=UPI001D1B9C1A|nr:type II toxin-antitoxin system HicA family toxin [Hyphomicrobium sp.]MBY0561538.1 type II toxin-antitoxin system HicA family toxin [Hyphomicrobium sp.]
MCYRRDIEEFAVARGWTVSRSKNNHLRFTHPERETVFGSSTPSDPRSILNIMAKLKRAERRAA